TLEKLGWTRGHAGDGGCFDEHSKPFAAAGVTAVVQYENGIPMGAIADWEDQKLKHCYFDQGLTGPMVYRGWYAGTGRAAELKAVDPVVLSEVIADLTILTSKG